MSGIGARMGTTVNMRAYYKDKEEWLLAEASAKLCDGVYGGEDDDEKCNNGCRLTEFYCPLAKSYAFFDVLRNHIPREYIPNTNEPHLESDAYSIITLTDLNNFDWEKEVFVRARNRQGFEEGMHKCTDICELFIKFTLPQLRALAEEHGGPDNVRIEFDFDV